MTRFFDYVSPAGNNLIAEWYCGISVDSRAVFDDLLDVLSKKAEWGYPDFKRLEEGLGEIKWSATGSNIASSGIRGRIRVAICC
jgi:hypothetical protein